MQCNRSIQLLHNCWNPEAWQLIPLYISLLWSAFLKDRLKTSEWRSDFKLEKKKTCPYTNGHVDYSAMVCKDEGARDHNYNTAVVCCAPPLLLVGQHHWYESISALQMKDLQASLFQMPPALFVHQLTSSLRCSRVIHAQLVSIWRMAERMWAGSTAVVRHPMGLKGKRWPIDQVLYLQKKLWPGSKSGSRDKRHQGALAPLAPHRPNNRISPLQSGGLPLGA